MELCKIREAVARGWCQPTTESLIMNPDLAEAISQEICKVDIEPNLGFATTFELIDELSARCHIAKSLGEEWPKYQTVIRNLF